MVYNSNKKSGSRDYDSDGSISYSHSFFGKTMRIEGQVTSDEDLTIEGKVEGQLEVSKTLNIGNDGVIDGEISAAVVRISGEAKGNLIASQKLEISSQGRYTGDIKAETIRVEEGANIKGTINFGDEKIDKKDKENNKERVIETKDPPAQKLDLTEKKKFSEKKEDPKKPMNDNNPKN